LSILLLMSLIGFAQVSSRIKLWCGTHDNQAREYFNSGNFGLENHLYKQSKTFFLAAVKIDPKFCDAWDNLSVCCRRMGLYDEAFNAGMQSTLIDSTNPTAWMNCGYACYLNSDIDKALISFDYLQYFVPGNPEGYYGKSMVLYSIDSIYEARINISRAEQCYKTSRIKKGPEVDLLKGFIEYKYGNILDAQKIFEKIYSKFRENAELNYYLGRCLQVTGGREKQNLANFYIERAVTLGYVIESNSKP
jgi:tetratricopeptide (TPR) repeat protein